MNLFKMMSLVLALGFSYSSFAAELTGAQLYQEMSSEEKQALEASLKEGEVELQDYLDTKISLDETTGAVSIVSADGSDLTDGSDIADGSDAVASTDATTVEGKDGCCDEFPAYYKRVKKKPINYKYNHWLVSGGITYLFPIGPGVVGEIAYQNKKGYKILKTEFSATTTGTFRKGAVQSYQVVPSVQFGRAKLHIGPVFQMLHVNNPMLEGQQNFFYKAMGANLGYEFTKNYRDRRWTFDLYAQSTLGGFHKDPTPFILVGGGLTIKYSSKTMKRMRLP